MAAVVVGIGNFVAFAGASAWLGGDALNGFAEGGRYFLRDKHRVTEVSAAVYAYSRLHALSLFVSHPLAVASTWLLALARRERL